MTDYAWFPVTQPSPGTYQWNPTGNWTDGAFWANATTITNPPMTGTVPGASDGAYIVAANIVSFLVPPNYSPPPYDVTLTLDTTQTVTTLGLASYSLLVAPHYPTLDIAGGSLDVTGAVLDTFSTTFPAPIGFQSFSGGGTIDLSGTARLEVGTTIGMSITITFTDASADAVVLDNVVSTSGSTNFVPNTFTNFNGGNAIDLPNFAYAGTTLTTYDPVSGNLLLTANTGTLALLTVKELVGSPSLTLAPDSGTGTEILVTCFVEGTRVLSPRGEVAVERLSAGDLVIAMEDGAEAARPITWIGRRRIDIRAHPRPDLVRPIRIRQGAIVESTPHRDLLVSPDHALLLDGVLVPARLLVNGTTIAPDATLASVRYFHVELDRHSVLLAEGLAAESYLDTGNGALFDNAGPATILHPDLATPRPRSWDADACAPLATDPARVEPIWRRLADRAEALGHRPFAPTPVIDPILWLEAEGGKASLVAAEASKRVFALPPGTKTVRLRSAAFRPSDRLPWLDDRRLLGVSVARIIVHGPSGEAELAIDDPALAPGWWEAERHGPRLARWTDGDALLTLPTPTNLVEIHLAGAA